ncbi:Hexaprenyldihydroxybenzoate methyltransferase, mitochondrial [Elasticomyces elasticus]|nr:Hexaprenyldihydroxybenzoate methyltransferase, mitochondrial [Elasticomyces elasticus]KAK3643261.1 Hexaprenyldihydroxybenzoate methyltransferase, mitochondrial [Elasticomyces elasticus]KAK4930251.1 Hexaprenyldihydroxybenzoate methyltransferase, mitochondrial [Elasticomyces elasticus]KAK5761414.1 Hexaprenyldihydroxybenzoate methyltransferase, mitochondrial [Elasticomyces elasticus]
MTASVLRLPTGLRQAVVHSSVRFTPSRIASSCPVSRSYATAYTASPTSSVNHTEVSHFNALASSWWDPHGSSRLLHLMNPLRHDFLHRCLAPEVRDPNQKLNFLDIGCGGGIFAESAARLAMAESVTAIDPTPETSIEDLHMHSDRKQYDIISLFEVIEHIQRPFPFLTASVLPYLKPGGWLIGSTIARHPVSWFTTIFMAEDVLGLVPRGTHDWSQYLQPQEVRDWARREPDLSTSEGLGWHVQGVVYVPGVGWKPVNGSEVYGNYFFGVKKREDLS